MKSAKNIIRLLRYGEALKQEKRSGWINTGVDGVREESVAEHTFGTTLIALLISKELLASGIQIDLGEVIAMALVHDLPESITTDIPYTLDKNELELKRKSEREAMARIASLNEDLGDWLLGLWEAPSEQASLAGRIAVGADILDMLSHAVALENSGVSPGILDEFFTTSNDRIKLLDLEIVTELFWELYQEHRDNCKRSGVNIRELSRK